MVSHCHERMLMVEYFCEIKRIDWTQECTLSALASLSARRMAQCYKIRLQQRKEEMEMTPVRAVNAVTSGERKGNGTCKNTDKEKWKNVIFKLILKHRDHSQTEHCSQHCFFNFDTCGVTTAEKDSKQIMYVPNGNRMPYARCYCLICFVM